MKDTHNLLKKKILNLESKIKKKDQLLKKYQKALTDSNIRISNIAKKLANSLSLIRDINKNLIPVQLPHISGFEFSYKFLPAKRGVSGDFFDIIKIKDSMRFGIIVSSCETYSLTSLFLSSFLKSATNIHKYKTAEDFVSFTAKKMKTNAPQKEKIHLFYGIISRSSLEMDYCLVGDIFVGHKKIGKKFDIFSPCSDNLLQQNKAENSFKGKKFILDPKDTLLICSPGVKYRENQNGSFFGINNIIQSAEKNPLAEVLEMRQNVLFACNDFGKNQPNKRDCTVLAVKTISALRLQNSSS
ncbi:MAG: SpoIIE family protein phosphatase [Oligoflexia bacterium]|nr:SpoIIE family protein phosphatase [Oligoflexia bacterium]